MTKAPASDAELRRGILYLAVGRRYVREASISAQSLRAFLPDLPICVATDEAPDEAYGFDRLLLLERCGMSPHLAKLAAMRRSPFAETLFLDTDTFACGSPAPLFDLLGAFDMAMALERRYEDIFPSGTGVPSSFPEFNQGVIAFRRSAEMAAVLDAALEWARAHEARTGTPIDDQNALRAVLFASGLRLAPLPLEYNCRFHSFGYVSGAVRILHGRLPGTEQNEASLRRIAEILNRRIVPRVFVGGRLYTLERRRLLRRERFHARFAGTLYRPRLLLLRELAKAIVRRFR